MKSISAKIYDQDYGNNINTLKSNFEVQKELINTFKKLLKSDTVMKYIERFCVYLILQCWPCNGYKGNFKIFSLMVFSWNLKNDFPFKFVAMIFASMHFWFRRFTFTQLKTDSSNCFPDISFLTNPCSFENLK